MRVRHGKGDRPRVVGIDDRAIDVIGRWLERRRALGFNGRPPRVRDISRARRSDDAWRPRRRELRREDAEAAGRSPDSKASGSIRTRYATHTRPSSPGSRLGPSADRCGQSDGRRRADIAPSRRVLLSDNGLAALGARVCADRSTYRPGVPPAPARGWRGGAPLPGFPDEHYLTAWWLLAAVNGSRHSR